MSIYIKGIDMPKDGSEKCIVIRSDGTITSLVGIKLDYATARQVSPHGRLVDADAYEKKLYKMVSVEDMSGIEKAIDDLEEMPTIIVADM